MITPRMNRLFAPDGRCFDVAIDHGFFNEARFLGGITNIETAVRSVATAEPDAVQLAPGQARHLQSLPGRSKPALVLRTDVANVYAQKLPRHLFSHLVEDAVEQALALDAACVVVNLMALPDQPEVFHQCIENITRLKADCSRYGMPLMVEPLVFRANDREGGYGVDGDAEKIVPLVRQAVELGADVIKADPTENPADFHRVVEIAGGVPVLARGGGRVSDQEILQRTAALMQQGAAGIVYGRNVIQHAHPGRMIKALMGVVHDGTDAETALRGLAA